MTHESDWIKSFQDEFFSAAAQLGCKSSWMKLAESVKRGVPDVWAFAADTSGRPKRLRHGPGAWIEFKRRKGWPTPVQAACLFGLAQSGVPCYLIQMLSVKQLIIYEVKDSAAANMYRLDPPFREAYAELFIGEWAPAAFQLVTLMADLDDGSL